MCEFVLGQEPWDEEYWRVLVEEGEHSHFSPPPVRLEEVWLGLGIEAPPAPEPDPAPEGEAEADDEGVWATAREVMEEAMVLELPAVGYNRGGLLVEWNDQQGFIPVSHLSDLPPYMDEKQREEELKKRVGQVLCLRIIEVNPDRRRLVLSERATRFDETHRQELLESLQPGDVRQGKVTNLCSFGAFVDLGGLEGLIHVSEISWGRVDHPADALQPGQEVEVYVLNVDKERGRVGLSLKRTQPNPWRTLEERYCVGQLLEGTITNVVDFGAFAEVEEGIEGLVHVSELAEGNFSHPRNVVREGQTLTLRVINVDSERRRLGLSLRQVDAPDDNAPILPEGEKSGGGNGPSEIRS